MSFDLRFIPLSFINSDEEILRQIKNTVLVSFLLNQHEETTLEYYLDTTQYGYTASALQSGQHKLVRITDINDGNVNWNTVPFCDCDSEDKYLLKENDILVARTGGTTGKSFIVENPPNNAVFASYLIRLRLNQKANINFINCFLNSYAFWSQIIEMKAGSAMPNVNAEKLKTLKLPKCDLVTQQKIMSKFKKGNQNDYNFLFDKISSIEHLYNDNKNLSTELSHQLTLVKKLRQQLLQDAVQGKLVAPSPLERAGGEADEPASELLKKIKAEKEKLIAEKNPSTSLRARKEKELPPIKPEEIPFEIPENWVWCRLGDLCIELLGGYAFDSTRYSKTETQNQVIRLGNVKPNQLVLETTPVFINDDYAKEALRASLCEGDILITMTGTRAKKDYLFSLCLTESDLQTKNLFLNQRVGCFRFGLFIVNNYINIALKDDRLLNAVFESSTGAANQANIGISALKDILIPLPPVAEKNRIVQKLDELMQYCNELEESIKQSQTQNEKLLQQVLREALRKVPVEA